MWIILILFQTAAFSVVVDSPDDCIAFAKVNAAYWLETGQTPKAVCVRTVEI